MRLTVRHHFDFGADRAVVGDDLVRPEAWDALRTQTSGAFALAETREEWERTADEHPELEARARRLDEVFDAPRGARRSPPTASAAPRSSAGSSASRRSATSSSPTTRRRRSSGCGRSSPRPSACVHDLSADPPLEADLHLFHRIDTEFDEPRAGRRSSSASRARADRVRGGRAGRSPRRAGGGAARAAGAGASRAGWVRTRPAIEALWRQTHTAVPVDVGDLPAWELGPGDAILWRDDGFKPRKALVTGITGQDGSYLAELLLQQGLRGPRHRPPLARASTPTGSTTSTATRTSTGVRLFLHYGDLIDAGRADQAALRAPAGRDLQPRRAEPRARLLRHPGVHGRRHRRSARCACSRRSASPGVDDALLPGVLVARCSAPRRRRRRRRRRSIRAARTPCAKVFAYWADGELPRGVRHVRLQRHPLQPRVAAPRRDLRHAQDHARRRAHQGRAAGQALPRQPRRQARLGLRGRLRRGDVADAPGRRARRLRRSPPARRTRCASSSSSRSRTPGSTGSRTSRSTRATSGPPRSTCCSATRRKARERLGWEPKVGFEELVRIMVDADVTALEDQLAGKVTRYSHEGDRLVGAQPAVRARASLRCGAARRA